MFAVRTGEKRDTDESEEKLKRLVLGGDWGEVGRA